MKRTTISLPDELASAVEREARRRRIPVSQLVREGLVAQLGRSSGVRKIAFAAVGRSGKHDTARNVDAILEAEWARARDH
jgi:Arc/MetJ-type ribon-helix-helix transcriptional regulator